MLTRRYVVTLLGLAVMTLTACGPASLPAASPPPAGVTEPAATAPPPAATGTPAPTAIPDPAGLCPTAGADQGLYLSRENGFCFLYPADFKIQPDFVRPQAAVMLQGPGETAGMEGIVTTLSVAYNGLAEGLDSQGYADKWQTVFRSEYGPGPLETAAAVVGGQPAVLVRRLPGAYASRRAALLTAGGFKYQVTAMPEPEDGTTLTAHVQRVWDLVTQSIVFFPPADAAPPVRAADVCPAPTADTQLWLNEAGGFCLLYPADYQLDPDFPGRIIGGPVLADTVDWGQVRTSVTVAAYDQPASALEQALTPPTEQIDPASVQSTTIGGAPAIVYDFTGGPWRQRTASIVANTSVYTLVGPWDAQHFLGSEAEAQKLWGTVIGSITFFDKWR